MSLFQLGDFTLRSGAKSRWKIECDALTPDDWAALAAMAVEVLPSFSEALGVPRGGIPFALALQKHCTGGEHHPILICEDVVTTGGSMERFVDFLKLPPHRLVIGVAVFARGPWPLWVHPIFSRLDVYEGEVRSYKG